MKIKNENKINPTLDLEQKQIELNNKLMFSNS